MNENNSYELSQYYAFLANTINTINIWIKSLNLTLFGEVVDLYMLVGYALLSAIIRILLGINDDDDLDVLRDYDGDEYY